MYSHEQNHLENQILKTDYFALQGSPKKCIYMENLC